MENNVKVARGDQQDPPTMWFLFLSSMHGWIHRSVISETVRNNLYANLYPSGQLALD